MNAAHIATVSSLKTDTIPAREDKDAVEKIADLARVLNGV
jgi:hypothetical protein